MRAGLLIAGDPGLRRDDGVLVTTGPARRRTGLCPGISEVIHNCARRSVRGSRFGAQCGMPSAILTRAPLVLAPAVRLIEPPPLADPAQQPLLPWARPAPAEVAEPEIEPALRQVAGRFASAVVEVLRGRRPLAHLEPYVEPPVHDLVGRLCAAGLRPTLRLASVHVQQPSPQVLEAAARIEWGEQSRAAALCLIRRGGQWRLVRLELALDAATVVRAG